MRVAVLGVPRGGTSMAVGMLRILGFRLPDVDPDCVLGESRRLRWADSPLHDTPEVLAGEVDRLPDRVVWKDPAVAMYADLIDWSSWLVVRVVRDPHAVAASEDRWLGGVDRWAMIDRAREWTARLNHIPASAEVTFTALRARPLIALDHLADATGRRVTRSARDQVMAFVQDTSGYRCPVPGTCQLNH